MISFFKHEKEGSQRLVINGALGPAVNLVALQCSSHPPPVQPPERDPNLPDGLERFSTFLFPLPQEQRDTIPNIKNTHFYHEGIFLLKNLTKTSSVGSTLSYIFLS